jgi:hypothetical protein
VVTFVLGLGICAFDELWSDPDSVRLKPLLGWGVSVSTVIFGGWCLAVWRRSYDRRKRIDQGRCAHCDYDLTGNLSGTCPECGEKINGAGVS